MERNNSITSIDLSFNEIRGSGTKFLADALEKNKTIVSINLSHNRIFDEGILSISAALLINKTIIDINLKDNRIGHQGAAAIATILLVSNFFAKQKKYNLMLCHPKHLFLIVGKQNTSRYQFIKQLYW